MLYPILDCDYSRFQVVMFLMIFDSDDCDDTRFRSFVIPMVQFFDDS